MKIGIIRCQQTEDMCAGLTDFKVIRDKKGAFENIREPIEVVGFVSCGGCPGKKVITRAEKMLKLGADAIVFASCITKGTPIGFACPYAEKMKEALLKRTDYQIKLIDYTH